MDNRVPGLFAVAVALLLLSTPFTLLPHAGESEYGHSIEPVAESEVPEEAEVLNYSALSPAARHAVDEALASEDGYALVHGEANKPPEFFYSDYSALGQGLYYLRKGGEHYELHTYAGGGLFPVDAWLQWLLVLYGAVLLVLGGWSVQDGRRRAPAAFGGVGAGLALAVGVDATPAGGLALLGVGLLSLLALVAATALAARGRREDGDGSDGNGGEGNGGGGESETAG